MVRTWTAQQTIRGLILLRWCAGSVSCVSVVVYGGRPDSGSRNLTPTGRHSFTSATPSSSESTTAGPSGPFVDGASSTTTAQSTGAGGQSIQGPGTAVHSTAAQSTRSSLRATGPTGQPGPGTSVAAPGSTGPAETAATRPTGCHTESGRPTSTLRSAPQFPPGSATRSITPMGSTWRNVSSRPTNLPCTYRAADPGRGVENRCVCGSVTLPLQMYTSGDRTFALPTCDYTTVPNVATSLTTKMVAWTSGCQLCSRAGVADPISCALVTYPCTVPGPTVITFATSTIIVTVT